MRSLVRAILSSPVRFDQLRNLVASGRCAPRYGSRGVALAPSNFLPGLTLIFTEIVFIAIVVISSASCGIRRWEDLEGTGTRVLVVANREDRSSLSVAYDYARLRGIARSHVLLLDLPRTEDIQRETFDQRLRRPLVQWWESRPEDERPDFICLMPGVPHRVRGGDGLEGTRASVDSELCLLPRWAAGQDVELAGRIGNPYYRPGPPYPPFHWKSDRICLVTRLAGWDEAQVRSLIERSLTAVPHNPAPQEVAARHVTVGTPAPKIAPFSRGRFLLDQREEDSPGNSWLEDAARRLNALGQAARLDTLSEFVGEADSLLGYAGWGSNDGQYRRDFAFRWQPGALATTFVSSSARTFRKPDADWEPGPAADSFREFGGTTQSLITDLIESGATGVSGNAFEPYLDGCARPQVLFPAYVSGRNLAEAFYLSLPYLSWQTVVVGDPLCRISHAPQRSP